MKDNYPPGAANDPNAPYNQDDPEEVEVVVRTEMKRLTTMVCTGRPLLDDYRNQRLTLGEALSAACLVLRELKRQGLTFVGGVHVGALLSDCEDWEEEELRVET